jgi:AcrR family transcriptional regulator
VSAGGRRRDPNLDGVIKGRATELLAEGGMAALKGDTIAERAGVGKASIYRRWPSMDDLLADVVRDLGVLEVDLDYGSGPGTSRGDVIHLLTAAGVGPRALAEAAVLPLVGRSEALKSAYVEGPITRLLFAVLGLERRARARGEAWVARAARLVIGAAVSELRVRAQETGREPAAEDIDELVDHIVLPVLTGGTPT